MEEPHYYFPNISEVKIELRNNLEVHLKYSEVINNPKKIKNLRRTFKLLKFEGSKLNSKIQKLA